MRFPPGTQLGTYELVGELGSGGMGEVYRAWDTSLRREVAIKLVNPRVCDDPDSMARLRREARALASLNHPHVAMVHELAEFDGFCGLVMELVAGETLAEALTRGPLPLGDILEIGSQIAAALEAAHEQGIVHRDLKPANIKITPDGSAKVLDFGLARSEKTEGALDTGAPLTTFATEAGLVLGTLAYMSPEQARGAAVDRRTDLWAFGCVLFEMLTGRRAFEGPSVSDTLVTILERDADWSALPGHTPPSVRRVLRRCLEKDARRRLRDAGDARLELEDAMAPERSGETGQTIAAGDAPMSARWVAMALVVTAVAAGAALATSLLRTPPLSAPVVRFAVALPAGDRLGNTDFPALAISPDGSFITYVAARGGSTQLLLRRLDAVDSASIPGTANATSPFFSPNNEWIAYFADGKLKKVPVAGGSPVTICDAATGFGGTWGRDDTIVFAPATGSALMRVPAGGGTPTRATRLDPQRGEFSHRWPEFLPDSATVLFTVGTVGEWDEAEIAAQSLDSGEPRILLTGGTHPHYLASGHLAYTHAGSVWAVPFDAQRLALTGPPVRALDGIAASVDGAAQFGASRTGAAVYVPSLNHTGRRLLSLEGSDTTPLAAPPHAYTAPRVSPDGRRLVIGIADDSEHIWVYDLTAGSMTQLTFDAANRSPIWSPGGQRITFSSNRNGPLNLFDMPADGSGPPERLTTSDHLQLPGSWSPDGMTLAFVEQHPSNGRDIWLLWRGADRAPFVTSPADESAPRFSPDGRWIAYVSTESGRAEVYARAFGGTAPARQISRDGGMEPVWGRDGRSLFYREGRRLMLVPILDATALRTSAARVVFEGSIESGTLDAANYDVMAGTTRFIAIAGATQDTATPEVRVVLNWKP